MAELDAGLDAEHIPVISSEQSSEVKPRSSKPALIGAVAILGALGLISSVQLWLHVEFVVGAAAVEALNVSGQKLNPALTLIALASLAAALVLMIAGKAFRRVIGMLVVLLGAGLAGLAFATISTPLGGASRLIGDATGISGDAQAALISEIELTLWPTVTLVVGLLLAVTGIFVTVLSGRWKTAGRKYDTGGVGDSPKSKRKTEPEGDRISDWDALSDGDDPTD